MTGKPVRFGIVLLAVLGVVFFAGTRVGHGGGSQAGVTSRADRIRHNLEARQPERLGDQGRTPADPDAGDARVVINGRALTRAQLDEFQAAYGARPAAGSWWYDPVSGLYGADGAPAAGFMFPGHAFGDLATDASLGRSGVFVNGRNLPREEVTVLSMLLGSPVLRGRYWLDALGNWGFEGNPVVWGNLYATVQAQLARAGGAGGGGGDNFWTSRFAAGNSNPSNTEGYVSIPGYGAVSYGF